jgi:GH25 family lysozyme M1 (1,4-beta-N-acetylmuramidase)
MNERVVDVSHHNGDVDFKAIKSAGIYGVIIRAGYGKLISQTDKCFEENYEKAKAAGLKVGAYWYSYAYSTAEAELEAMTFLDVIRGKCFELPVYYDVEEKKHQRLGKDKVSAIITTFCDIVEKKGYFVGVYSADSWFKDYISDDVKRRYTCWVAHVENIKPKYISKYDMWQYTWKATFPNCKQPNGKKTDFDCSYLYKDFETIIKAKNLNGYAPNTVYKITATISTASESIAQKCYTECKTLGMSVTKDEIR